MDSPYKGLVPYAQEDAEYFFGRDEERRVIAANLCASPLTVLYAESGVGKSSVLNAGVAYDLKDDLDYIPLVFSSWAGDPMAGLRNAVGKAIGGDGGNGASDAVPRDLFTVLRDWNDPARRTLLVILDQFEEYFQYHRNENGARTFADEFPRLVDRSDFAVNFLVSVREDSLAWLDRFKGRIPNLFDNYLRAAYLSREAAKDAVLKPLDKFNATHPDRAITMDEKLAERALDEMLKAQPKDQADKRQWRVQPPYLQLVMSRWWEREADSGSEEMRWETLQDGLGGVRSIVENHVQRAVAGLDHQQQETAAEIFSRMATPDGRKFAHTVPDLVAVVKAPNPMVEDLMQHMVAIRVMMPVGAPGAQPGEESYEFAHDVVAQAAYQWAERYKQQQELGRANEEREAAQRRAEELERLKQQAEEQQRIATARERVAYALASLQEDPERSLLLAMHAANATYSHDRTTPPEVEEVVHMALLESRIRLTLKGHESYVHSVAWSPDGERLATADGYGVIQVYAMDIDLLLSLAGSRVTRNLTLDECRKYLHMDEVPPIPFGPAQ